MIILKFQMNWTKQCRVIGILKLLFFISLYIFPYFTHTTHPSQRGLTFIPHNRGVVGKIIGNKTCDVTVGELKNCRKLETVLVSRSQSTLENSDVLCGHKLHKQCKSQDPFPTNDSARPQ